MSKACRGLVAGLACGLFLVMSLIVLSMWNAGKMGGGAAITLLVFYLGGSIGAWCWMLGKK